ncbi:M23 family metallopeptidase [Nocardia callitridis]|uniref:M23ase beta-sheet core domain-containing protein n=1 Tax=Nocardia callitridis TaxID=648753 RepID=A0ABP9JU35_9NOCA
MLEEVDRPGLDRARTAGGIGVIPRGPRAFLRERRSWRGRVDWSKVRASAHPLSVWHRLDLPGRWNNRPDRDELVAVLRAHRVLIAALVAVAALTAGDTTFGGLTTDRTPLPGAAQRVAVTHPLLVASTPSSVRRYLNAIATGEHLREQGVVTDAARATLERAKAEAAAAISGQQQPWLSAGGATGPGSIPPGVGGYVLPAIGTFTSGFGSRWGTFHAGIDIAGPIGTPIYAVANGTVIDAGPAQGFGLWVRIRHDDGSITVYGHMYDFFVSVGERVPAGLQIARVGNRGDSTGPHLHFEVVLNGEHVDPQRWLALHGLNLG